VFRSSAFVIAILNPRHALDPELNYRKCVMLALSKNLNVPRINDHAKSEVAAWRMSANEKNQEQE
jgi:hypothetical protein